MADAKPWTVLVWMAGDNDLQDFGTGDLGELKKTGSTDAVNVVVQLDRMSDSNTRRYYVRRGTTADEDVVAHLGETNTGDPAVAADFLTWGMRTYPAEHYLAVLWNHGSGIDETDIYRRAGAAGLSVRRGAKPSSGVVPRSQVRAIVSHRTRRALFSTTIDSAIRTRALAYDDTSRDFLDNAELKRVLTKVKQATKRKIDLLGFDACLMNLVEVAYQLRDTAGLIVGSQETEPGDGWPYDRVLADLAAKPGMSPAELGATIVRRYVDSYSNDAVTQSLLDLARMSTMKSVCDALGRALEKAVRNPTEYAAITKAVLNAQRYEYRDFLDLYDLCSQLKQRCKTQAVKDAAQNVMDALVVGDRRLVAAEKHKGGVVSRSRGVSIYFPRGDVTVAYPKLDFARATRWDDFLRAYQGA
jgi:hypothetical protein